jgi:maltooligosyltrehalose trehalohydrolase
MHVALTGETQGYYADFADPGALAKVMRTPFFHDGTWSSFRGRRHGRQVDADSAPGWRFVASLQTHDQVGNRAQGDRLSASLDPGLLACGAAMLLTSPWTPMLFMGEEWGAATPWQFFTDHTNPDIAAATAQGRKAEFAEHGWDEADVPDPQDPETFRRSKLDWSELSREPHARVLGWYRDLLALRRAEPELRAPCAASDDVSWADGHLRLCRGRFTVLVNLDEQPWRHDADGYDVVLSWDASHSGAADVVDVPGRSAVVLRRPPI